MLFVVIVAWTVLGFAVLAVSPAWAFWPLLVGSAALVAFGFHYRAAVALYRLRGRWYAWRLGSAGRPTMDVGVPEGLPFPALTAEQAAAVLDRPVEVLRADVRRIREQYPPPDDPGSRGTDGQRGDGS